MNPSETAKRRVSVDLSQEMVAWLDGLKPQFGLRSRGAILERLLSELRLQDSDDDGVDDEEDLVIVADAEHRDRPDGEPEAEANEPSQSIPLDETRALVLIPRSLLAGADQDSSLGADAFDENAMSENDLSGSAAMTLGTRQRRPASSGAQRTSSSSAVDDGIQLPGFLRRQARQLRRSLQADALPRGDGSLSLISGSDLDQALERADHHWQAVYGQSASETVLEAAMVWLARDLWPQSDQSEGRPFTWALVQQVVSSFAPTWLQGDPSFARVIAAAGVLEDPFSGSTLALRVPTLITRFVQRQRSRQKRTTSFEAIDQTMTVHAALRLLQLPTVADRPYSLQEIREAYRQLAQSHHPDAGGSADAMRRLNEAYQFLKERYWRAA